MVPSLLTVHWARVVVLLTSFCLGDCGLTRHDVASDTPDLIAGLGSLEHHIATRNSDAQRFFDQGLKLVYAFNFGSAVRSFERSADLDPTSPMPYWGIALALGPNYNAWGMGESRAQRAYTAIQKALVISANAPENERALVNALAQRYANNEGGDQNALGRNYSTAMGALTRQYPDDPDINVLYADSLMVLHPWHLWANDGQPGEKTEEILTILEGALRRWPDHLGANHLYIHLMEGSPFPERALMSAKRLETLAPAAGHLLHMPAHVYFRTGDYAAAVTSCLKAKTADEEYLQAHPLMAMSYKGYAEHNLYFLAAAAAMSGEFSTASTTAEKLGAGAHSEAFLVTPLLVLMRFARWDDVARTPQPDEEAWGVRFFWRYARGCAFAAKRQLTYAEDERRAMEREVERLPKGRAFGMFFNDWTTLHDLASLSLQARIAGARGENALAIRLWRTAVEVQDRMRFDDIPDWYYPLRESLGAALLRGGHSAEAERVFREDLVRTPRNPRSLFGLWKALEVQGLSVSAAWVHTAFIAVWRGENIRIEDL